MSLMQNDEENRAVETETAEKGEGKVYEVGYLIVPTVPEEKLAEEVVAIKSIIEKQGGTFISDDFPRRRVLAYEMPKVVEGKKHKFKEGFFGWVKFEVSSDSLSEIKKALETNDHVLRFLLINTVRENTLYFPKVSTMKKEDGSPEPTEEGKPAASAEEIDKSIDALVIE